MFIKSPVRMFITRVVACVLLLAMVLRVGMIIPVTLENVQEHMEVVVFVAIVAISVLAVLAFKRLLSDARAARSNAENDTTPDPLR
jgi:hypothetical protein